MLLLSGKVKTNCLSKKHYSKPAVIEATLILALFLSLSLPAVGQELDTGAYIGAPYLSFKLTPGMIIPLFTSAELFSAGGNLELAADYRLLPFLKAEAGLSYSILPVRSETRDIVNLFSLGAGAALDFEVSRNFNLGAYGRGGVFYGFIGGADPVGSANPTVQGGLYASYRLLPFLSLGIDAAYRNFFGLSTDVSLSLGASYHFYYSSPGILELSEPELRVFPILFKYYDKNRISTITLRNQTDQPIRDITVQFFSQEFMVNPKLCAAPFRLAPGEEKLLEVYGLFTDKMLTVSEGTKVSANISVDFQFKGKDYSKNLVTTLDVISRNGIIWDDDRKASCFVTAKDPSVLRFSKTVSALLRDRPVMEFDHALLKAMVLHSALNLYGLAYMQDPSTPYAEFSQRRTAVDFLQFPNQTLEYKGGDCDDLSILYSALLESLGIETAFITIPGHIFMAFRLSSDEKSIRSNFRNSTDFIVREDGVWVPVEVTSISNGFLCTKPGRSMNRWGFQVCSLQSLCLRIIWCSTDSRKSWTGSSNGKWNPK